MLMDICRLFWPTCAWNVVFFWISHTFFCTATCAYAFAVECSSLFIPFSSDGCQCVSLHVQNTVGPSSETKSQRKGLCGIAEDAKYSLAQIGRGQTTAHLYQWFPHAGRVWHIAKPQVPCKPSSCCCCFPSCIFCFVWLRSRPLEC